MCCLLLLASDVPWTAAPQPLISVASGAQQIAVARRGSSVDVRTEGARSASAHEGFVFEQCCCCGRVEKEGAVRTSAKGGEQ